MNKLQDICTKMLDVQPRIASGIVERFRYKYAHKHEEQIWDQCLGYGNPVKYYEKRLEVFKRYVGINHKEELRE